MKYNAKGEPDVQKNVYTMMIISTIAEVIIAICLIVALYLMYPLIPIFE